MCYIEIIDNVLVTALIDRGCLERIIEVLKPLKEAGLKLKRERCILQHLVEYLGHLIMQMNFIHYQTK